MKNFIRLSLSLMAMTLFFGSCSRSQENEGKGTPAAMVINFENPKVRASGTPGSESAIHSGTIMVFRAGTGTLDGMATFSSIANPVTVNITAGQRDVYVVANTGLDFSTINNVSQLKNMTTKYTLTSISTTGDQLPMSGKTSATVDASAATMTSPASATVNMVYMCSKVNIAWDLTQLGTSLTGLTVKKVYVMNVLSTTDCFATAPDILTSYSTAFLTGKVNTTSSSSSTYYPKSPATNAYNSILELDPAGTSNSNFFYIFENNVATSPTIVVIEALLGTTTYYYPIVINGTQNTNSTGDGTATVVRGKNYTVKAIIKGFGNVDPYEPIIKAAMNVTITAPTWTVVAIEEIFQ